MAIREQQINYQRGVSMFRIIHKYRLWGKGYKFGAKSIEGTYAILELDVTGTNLLGNASVFYVLPVFYAEPKAAMRAVRRLQQLADGKTYALARMPVEPGGFVVSPEQ
jgi:hypothetical protein